MRVSKNVLLNTGISVSQIGSVSFPRDSERQNTENRASPFRVMKTPVFPYRGHCGQVLNLVVWVVESPTVKKPSQGTEDSRPGDSKMSASNIAPQQKLFLVSRKSINPRSSDEVKRPSYVMQNNFLKIGTRDSKHLLCTLL